MISRFPERQSNNSRYSFECHQKTFPASNMSFGVNRKSVEVNKIVIAGLENIANEIGCSKKTLYKWIRYRRFPAFKMDGVWRAMPKDIEAWFDCIRLDRPGRRS